MLTLPYCPERLTKRGGLLSVVEHYTVDGVIYFRVHCSICSQDTELHKEPFIQIKSDWNKGAIPCSCSIHPYYDERQAIIVANRRCKALGKEFHGFTSSFKGMSKTKVFGKCSVHKLVEWDNIFNYLKKTSECPICSKRRPLFGVGINDADYDVRACHYYSTWSDMIRRCHYVPYQTKNPTYIGCSVAENWKVFSNFKSWMEKQDWEGKQLDKDLLVAGNKVYSEDNCIFISGAINSLLASRVASKVGSPRGVCSRKAGSYSASCSGKYLGMFDSEMEAHSAWQCAIVDKILYLSQGQCDVVAKRLNEIAANIIEDNKLNRVTIKI